MEIGDIGLVRGRFGMWVVTGGAPLPIGIEAANAAAEDGIEREAGEAINVMSEHHGRAVVFSSDFVALHDATESERRAAGFDC